MSPVTLKTISEKTGFSITTVSRALAGYSDVSSKTREKITRAAQELGYYPNLTARQLQSQKTNTVGIILPTNGPTFADPYFSQLIAGIGDGLAESSYDLLISTHAPDADELIAYRHMVEGRRVDGLIVVRTRLQDERIAYLAQTDLPFVVFGRTNLNVDYTHIDADSYSGMYRLVSHLIEQGYTRIGYIGAAPEYLFGNLRVEGYMQAHEDAGIELGAEHIVVGDLTEQGGAKGTRQLLAAQPDLQAIVATNDLMALGAISVVQEMGLTVGKDIAIAGFDDIPAAEVFSLTTLRQPIYEIGTKLSAMVLDLIREEPLENNQVLIEPELILRTSTSGKPKD